MTDTDEKQTRAGGWLRRGWVQGILIALLLLASAAGLLIWSVVPLLNHWLPPLLDQFVAPGSDLRISRVNGEEIVVDELNLTPAPGVVIQLRNARLTYDGLSLLQGKADSLSADSLRITMTAAPDTPAALSTTAPASLSTDVSLPSINDLMALPVSHIDVRELQIDTPDVSAQLSATLTPELWWLRGSAHLPQIPDDVQIEAQLQNASGERADLLLMLSSRQELLAQLWAGLRQDDDMTYSDLRLQGDLAALQSSLPLLSDQPLRLKELIINGTLSSPNDARWPEALSADLNASLTTRRSTLADDMSVSKGRLSLTLQHSDSDAPWLAALNLEPISVAMKLDGDDWLGQLPLQSVKAECHSDLSDCHLTSELMARLSGPTTSDVRLTPDLHWQLSGTSKLSLPLSLSYSQPALDGLPAWSMTTKGSLSATLQDDQSWTLTSGAGLTVLASVQKYEGWDISPLRATLLQDLTISGSLADDRSVESSRWQVMLTPVTLTSADASLSFGRSDAWCDPGTITTAAATDALLGNCHISVTLNDSRWGLWPVPDVQLDGPLTLTFDDLRQRVNAALDLTAANKEIHFRTRLEHDLQTNKGSLQWHLTDARLDWHALGLSEMENLTSAQLLNGRLSGQGWIDWQEQNGAWEVTPDIMLRADGLSLIYDNSITLEEWNAMVALRRPANGDYFLDAQVSGSRLDSGIPLTNLLARSQTRIPADFSYVDVSVYEMHTDLLGGRVYTPLIRYDSRKEINAFGIRLDHLQLSQIAAIEEGAGVDASGLLDGMLPIVINADGIMIPGGNLFARDPGGVIKYQGDSADALAQSDQSVGLAMTLLSNFQYDQLQSGIQYQPDGQLNLALQFQGKNPDFFGGQATHLNVNLEYNLLDLLESLRIANDVIEKVESKYK